MNTTRDDATFRRAALLLALVTWLVYAMTSDGTLTIDPLSRWDVSYNVVARGTLAQPGPGVHTLEHEGRHYGVFLPGQSVELLPFAAVAVGLERALGINAETASLIGRFIACTIYVPAVCALVVLGHLALVRGLGVGPRTAIASGLVVAFGTPLWVWGTRGSEEPTIAALTMWSFVALFDARVMAGGGGDEDDPRLASRFVDRIGFAGVLLAFGLIHRSPFVAVCVGALVFALPVMVRRFDLLRAAGGRFILWTLATVAILAIVPIHNWLRFGDALDTGYTRYFEPIGGIWETPLLTGVWGLLFSPGKSVFLYVPWLVLLPVALFSATVRERLGGLKWSLAVIVVLHLVIYGLHTFWHGAFGWGVRFNVSLMPLLLVPIAMWIGTIRLTAGRRATLCVVAAVSIVVQIAGGSLHWGLELRQHPEHYGGWLDVQPEGAAWTWQGSQLRNRFVNIADKLRGRNLIEVPDDHPAQIVAGWNAFPVRAGWGLDSRRVVAALWVFWSLLGLALIAAATTLTQTWRRLTNTGTGTVFPAR